MAALRAPGLVATTLAAMGQEHERAACAWQAEWWSRPELSLLAAGALRALTDLVPDLEVNTARMRSNLDLTHGLIFAEGLAMAFAPHLGRGAAKAHVEALCERAMRGEAPLRALAHDDATVRRWLASERIDSLFEPDLNLGHSVAFVDSAVSAWTKQRRAAVVQKVQGRDTANKK